MKIAFLGTSEFAVPALRALVEAGHDVAAVYTRAPKAAGRGQQERKTPVHLLADTLGLPVRTPKNLKGNDEAHWDKIASAYRDNKETWEKETVPPSKRAKSVV